MSAVRSPSGSRRRHLLGRPGRRARIRGARSGRARFTSNLCGAHPASGNRVPAGASGEPRPVQPVAQQRLRSRRARGPRTIAPSRRAGLRPPRPPPPPVAPDAEYRRRPPTHRGRPRAPRDRRTEPTRWQLAPASRSTPGSELHRKVPGRARPGRARPPPRASPARAHCSCPVVEPQTRRAALTTAHRSGPHRCLRRASRTVSCSAPPAVRERPA